MRMTPFIRLSATALAIGLVLTGCSKPASTAATSSEVSVAKTDATSAAVLVDTDFNPSYREYLKTLASDEFQGRMPATPGEEKTVNYLSEHFKRLGLKGIDGESYLQPVSLVRIDPKEVSSLKIAGETLNVELAYKEQMMAWTTQVQEHVEVKDSDMVFVGYGVIAPEYNWNDYEGIDVKGKTVVMFVNDPGFATEDPNLFTGKAMTYYGRWTYKLEEAARQGAAMALIIHETEPAAYGWQVVAGGSPTKFDLINPNKNRDRSVVEGWLTTESAEQLFASVGSNIAKMREKALGKDFRAIPLNAKASVSVKSHISELTSSNVMGYIEGSEKPEEVVLYMAHWDHLGVDFSNPNDKVFNGAQDNASGTAAVMAMAEHFAKQPQPKRSVAFLAVTAEERGLLGSAWYAKNPVFPLNKTVAGINMDVMNVDGPMKDMVVVGYNNSELETLLTKYTEQQNRYVAPEPSPEHGSFYRSDHFNLAKVGVPMLYAKGGIDSFAHGKEWGMAQKKEYNSCCYHKVGDNFNENWDLGGAQQDMAVFFRIGSELANSGDWPNWYEGREFKAARDASLISK